MSFRAELCVAGGVELLQASVVLSCLWIFHTSWVPVVLSVQELWPCHSAVNNSVLEDIVMKINDYKV